MSFLARTATTALVRPRSIRQVQQLRSMHVNNVVGANMPFSYDKKFSLGAKVSVFLVSGFALPFVAAAYQRSKKGGGA